MIKVYIGKTLDGISYLPLLKPNLGGWKKESRPFFDKAIKGLSEPIFEIVDDYNYADFLLIPHEYFAIEKNLGYLESFFKISKEIKKKVLVFDMSDFDKEISVPNAVVFRMAQYRGRLKENEIIMPAIIGDIWEEKKMEPRKKTQKPIVSFCGWGEIGGLKQKIKFFLKNIIKRGPFKQGIYFRKKALRMIERSKLVNKNLLVRTFYSGHKNTLAIPHEQARSEFLNNFDGGDLALSVKGDGNYSVRFYEALSAGRVPVFIDTDCVLPLENKLNYDEFMLRIDYKEINRLDQIIADFWQKISPEEFLEMQIKARRAYNDFLNISSFFKVIEADLLNLK